MDTNEDAKMLVALLKKAGLFTNSKGDPFWRIKITDKPEQIDFIDSPVKVFMGHSFVNKETDKIYLNPPKELLLFINKDKKKLFRNEEKISENESKYGPNIFYGYYRVGAGKKASIEKLEEEIEEGDDVELNHSDMRSWALRKAAEFMLHETADYETSLACLTSQMQHINYIDSSAISELAEVLESIKKKVVKKEEEVKVDSEKITKLKSDINKYETALKNPKYDETKIKKIEKTLKKLKNELDQ